MAYFYPNGDESFKKESENLVKADLLLVKQNVMLPKMLLAPQNKYFLKNCDPKEKYVRRKISRTPNEPEICKSTNKLNRKMKTVEATVNRSQNWIEENRSAPPGFPKYPCLENFISKSTLHNHPKFKSTPIFASPSTKNNLSSTEETSALSEYNYSEKSPPVEEKDLGSKLKVQNCCLENCEKSSNKSITEPKLENKKSKFSESVEDEVINIFTLSDDHRSISSLSINVNDSIRNVKVCSSSFNREECITSDNKNDNQKSILIDENYTTTNILKSEESKLDCHIKYSWQDIENWTSPTQKEEITKAEKSNHECKITYSWQVLGISTQTSLQLLQNVRVDHDFDRYKCDIKYSWQIVGKSTQISLNNYENRSSFNGDYWNGSVLSPRENYNKWNQIKSPIDSLNKNKTIVLYSEGTQTLADKRTQTETTDCRVKYSWENLIQQHLKSLASSKFDALERIPYDNHCVKNLKTYLEPIKCCAKYSWENLIRQRLKSKEPEY